MRYTEEEVKNHFDYIIAEIEKGRSLNSILAPKDRPSRTAFYEWIDANPELANKYARACSLRADKIFDEILEISDKCENDLIKTEDGSRVANHAAIQRARLMVDSRKWMLGKMNPKKYGKTLHTENSHTGDLNVTIVRKIKE